MLLLFIYLTLVFFGEISLDVDYHWDYSGDWAELQGIQYNKYHSRSILVLAVLTILFSLGGRVIVYIILSIDVIIVSFYSLKSHTKIESK